MSAVKTSYPEFVPNQVLTNTQLNQLREHLDAQDRLGRIRLVGTGKVCGLQWRRDATTHRITVCEGFGVSSDGYLVGLEEDTTFTHYRTYTDPDVDEEGEPRYAPWQTPGAVPGQRDILELLDAAAAAEAGSATPLAAGTGAGRVLVLYLEKLPVELRSCLVTDCDNKGLNIHLTVRVLLVKKTDLQAVASCQGPLPMARIPRLHTQVNLRAVVTAANINDGYRSIVTTAAGPLLQKIKDAAGRYGKFLDLGADFVTRVSALEQRMTSAANAKTLNQYHYDAVKDVAMAYNEAVAAACELITDCCPEGDFPRHLMIGALDAAAGFAHEFLPSPVRNVVRGDLERVRKLFLRIEALCQSMDFGGGGGKVFITPSHTEAHALGARAIPFYYKDSAALRETWQPKRCCTTEPPWWYHTHADPSSDLEYDYNRCTFLRIEGHLGAACDAAAAAIRKERRQHNVALRVLCTYLGASDGEADLVKALAEIRQKRAELVGNLRQALPAGASSDVKGIAKDLRDLGRQVLEARAQWRATVAGEKLHCDLSYLQADYLAVRSALHCQFHALRGTLGRIAQALSRPKKELVGIDLVPGATLALVDRLTAGIAAQREASKVTDQRVSEALEVLAEPDAARLLPLVLQTALDSLLENLRALLEEHLPLDLRELHHGLFLERYKAVICDLIHFLLLVHAYDVSITGEMVQGEIGEDDAPAPEEEELIIHELLAAVRSCHHVQVTTLYHAYLHLRQRDLTRFANLAAAVDGLEHLAGVEKCGTLVLVCEPAGANGKVVADFSLPCHPPCCCEVDPKSLCLPPVALPDYRIVTLQTEDDGKSYLPVDRVFELLANDHDPRFQTGPKGPPAPPLELVLDQEQSELGAKLKVVEGGMVQYTLNKPAPGAVDRFAYRLVRKDETCAGEDSACVLVLLVPEPRTETGTVTGTVYVQPEKVAPESTVTILETGETTLTDGEGSYRFVDLASGSYTLRAMLGDLVSADQAVSIRGGDTVTVDLMLLAGTASVSGTVRFADGVPAAGSKVVVLETGDTYTAASDGTYAFTSLSPASYTLQASFGELVSESKAVTLRANVAMVGVDFTLPAQKGTGTLRVTVHDPSGKTLRAINVSLTDSPTGGETVAIQRSTDEAGVALFEGISAGPYDVSASGTGFVAQSKKNVPVEAGPATELDFVLQRTEKGRLPVNENLVGLVAEMDGTAMADARVKVEDIYGERYEVRLGDLRTAAQNPSVKASTSYQRAETFMTATLTDPAVDDAALAAAYRDVSGTLVKAIQAAGPTRKDTYRDLLGSVTLGFMDRLTLSNADILSPETTGVLEEISATLKQAGVAMDQLRGDWNGEQLKDELSLDSTDTMMEFLS